MQKNIVCFGDSNTHGYNAEDGGRFDENTRWTRLLQKWLGNGFNVVEEGLSGRTACFDDPCYEGLSGLSVINPILMSHEPISLLIIMLGTNDTKSRFAATPHNIGDCLARLIKKAEAADCWAGNTPNILVVAPTPILKGYEQTTVINTMGAGCSEKSYALAAVFKNIAALRGCHYLDASSAQSNTIDCMHLDATGHRQLAEKLTELVPNITH